MHVMREANMIPGQHPKAAHQAQAGMLYQMVVVHAGQTGARAGIKAVMRMCFDVVQVDNVLMSARNIEKLEVNFASAVRVYDVLRADKIVIEEEALQYIQVSASP